MGERDSRKPAREALAVVTKGSHRFKPVVGPWLRTVRRWGSNQASWHGCVVLGTGGAAVGCVHAAQIMVSQWGVTGGVEACRAVFGGRRQVCDRDAGALVEARLSAREQRQHGAEEEAVHFDGVRWTCRPGTAGYELAMKNLVKRGGVTCLVEPLS